LEACFRCTETLQSMCEGRISMHLENDEVDISTQYVRVAETQDPTLIAVVMEIGNCCRHGDRSIPQSMCYGKLWGSSELGTASNLLLTKQSHTPKYTAGETSRLYLRHPRTNECHSQLKAYRQPTQKGSLFIRAQGKN